jgi:hypothetical protein
LDWVYSLSYRYFFRSLSKISWYHQTVGLDGPGFESGRARDFLFSKAVHAGCGAHSTSYSVGTRVLFWVYSGRGVKFTTHLHLIPRSVMGGTILYFNLLYFT